MDWRIVLLSITINLEKLARIKKEDCRLFSIWGVHKERSWKNVHHNLTMNFILTRMLLMVELSSLWFWLQSKRRRKKMRKWRRKRKKNKLPTKPTLLNRFSTKKNGVYFIIHSSYFQTMPKGIKSLWWSIWS